MSTLFFFRANYFVAGKTSVVVKALVYELEGCGFEI
jgi:hypothetical protein